MCDEVHHSVGSPANECSPCCFHGGVRMSLFWFCITESLWKCKLFIQGQWLSFLLYHLRDWFCQLCSTSLESRRGSLNWMRGYFFRTFKSLTVDRDWRCPKEVLTEIDTCSKRDTEVATWRDTERLTRREINKLETQNERWNTRDWELRKKLKYTVRKEQCEEKGRNSEGAKQSQRDREKWTERHRLIEK